LWCLCNFSGLLNPHIDRRARKKASAGPESLAASSAATGGKFRRELIITAILMYKFRAMQ
jgi:hypothetical protein